MINPFTNIVFTQSTGIITNQVLNTAISQSTENIIEGSIKISLILASSNLITQEALKNTLTCISNQYGKEIVLKTVINFAAEGIYR